jgi:hypothetical protein
MDGFLVGKWTAILRLKEEGPTAPALRELEAVRSRAWQKEHWETVRDSDRCLALATADLALARHLYRGTPFASFRQKLARQMDNDSLSGEGYVWNLGPSPAERTLDLRTGLDDRGREVFKPAQGENRLLQVLSSDFYRPFRLASLYARLFEGEYFNPTSSPDRVHRALLRLRRALERSHFPLTIEEREGSYRLAATGACALALPKEGEAVDRKEYLHLEQRATQLLLKQAVATGNLLRVGKGPSTHYRFQ